MASNGSDEGHRKYFPRWKEILPLMEYNPKLFRWTDSTKEITKRRIVSHVKRNSMEHGIFAANLNASGYSSFFAGREPFAMTDLQRLLFKVTVSRGESGGRTVDMDRFNPPVKYRNDLSPNHGNHPHQSRNAIMTEWIKNGREEIDYKIATEYIGNMTGAKGKYSYKKDAPVWKTESKMKSTATSLLNGLFYLQDNSVIAAMTRITELPGLTGKIANYLVDREDEMAGEMSRIEASGKPVPDDLDDDWLDHAFDVVTFLRNRNEYIDVYDRFLESRNVDVATVTTNVKLNFLVKPFLESSISSRDSGTSNRVKLLREFSNDLSRFIGKITKDKYMKKYPVPARTVDCLFGDVIGRALERNKEDRFCGYTKPFDVSL
jgi:hypothetical protein